MKTLSPTRANPHRTVRHDAEHVVEDGAFLHKLVLAPVEADEAFLAVDVQPLVADTTAAALNLLDLLVTRCGACALAVFLLQRLEPLDRIWRQVFSRRFTSLIPSSIS